MLQSQELAGKTHQTTIVVLQMGNMQANLERLLQHNLRTPKKKIKKQQINLCVISSPLPRDSLYNDGFLNQLSSIKPNCIENPQFHQLPTCQRLSTVSTSFHNVHQSLP
jgi:hypothetical protein